MIPRFRPPFLFRDIFVMAKFKRNHEIMIRLFETSFAKEANQEYARVFPYGRTALKAVLEYLKTLAQGEGRNEIICPSYTCVVVAHAIIESNLVPIFVDCSSDSLNMNWEDVHSATSRKTLAVISTSLFGNPIPKRDIESFRNLFPEVYVIQDCAHSFFAGNLHKEGVAAIYGLNISKLVSSIFGGMVTTNDSKLDEWLEDYQKQKLKSPTLMRTIHRLLYFFGALIAFSPLFYRLTFYLKKLGILNRFTNYYNPATIEFPKDAYQQIGVFECLLGIKSVKRYREEIARRQNLVSEYLKRLLPSTLVSPINYGENASYSHFVIKSKYAEKIYSLMVNSGIELGRIVDYDVASLPAYIDAPYYGRGFSHNIYKHVLNLPIHKGISLRKVNLISQELNKSLNRLDLD